MKLLLARVIAPVALWLATQGLLNAQSLTFSTLAGSPGHGTANGTGAAAQFFFPGGMAASPSGFLFVADTYNHCIRKIEIATGDVTTFAGLAGTPGSADGPAADARFKYPVGLVLDTAGSLYVADSGNFTIRKVTSGGSVSTFAGQAGVNDHQNGDGTGATFSNLQGLAIDEARDFLYVADTDNHMIRRVRLSSAQVTTLGGAWNQPGALDGSIEGSRFRFPTGLVVDGAGNLHVADSGNHILRQITTSDFVFTYAGSSQTPGYVDAKGGTARFNRPMGLSIDAAGNVYVADMGNGAVRKISSTFAVTTLGPRTLNFPRATAVSGSTVFVADTGLHVIRRIDSMGVMTLLAGRSPAGSTNGVGTAASFSLPDALTIRADGVIFIADSANHTIRRVNPDGTTSTFAGQPGSPGSSDGGGLARFNSPGGIVSDSLGNLYVADTGNHTIRKVGIDGFVTTLAGTAGLTGSANGTGAAARFNTPRGVALGAGGNLFVADSRNHTIRKITPAGVVSTFAGTAGSFFWLDATGTQARFNTPTGLDFDKNGNLVVADRFNRVIRRISSTGVVTTIAGSPPSLGFADGTGTAARFGEPVGVAVDASNNVWVSDFYYHNLRRITPARAVTTQAGAAWLVNQDTILDYLPYGGDVNGAASAATFYHPMDIAFDVSGALYVMDRSNCLLRKGVFDPVPGAPVITSQPASQNVVSGAPVNFMVTATGASLTYQWYKDSVMLAGQTADTLSIASAGAGDEGAYTVVVTSNGTVSATSNAAILRVITAPLITQDPVSVVAGEGQTVSFRVKATGVFLTYQWKKGGVDIPTGTDAVLTITNVQASDDDVYTVEVTNAAGSDLSDPATLKVQVPPAILAQPAAAIRAKDAPSVSFTVGTTGTYLEYQWYKGTKAIPAASNASAVTATLTLTGIQIADAAEYKVVIKNTQGTKTSAFASLVVVDTTTAFAVSQVQGKSIAMNPAAYGKGITNYQWRFNGADITTEGVPKKYANFTGRTLTVFNVLDPSTSPPGDEGPYTCLITTPAGSLQTGPVNLEVVIRPVVNPIVFAPSSILVSQPFSYTPSAANNPTKYTITGLPKGLTYNSTTGEISGRPQVASRPTVPTEFLIKISASNAAGASLVAQQATLHVDPFNTALLGGYQGRVVRDVNVTDNLGGKMTITVPPSGVSSGSLSMNKINSPFTAALDTSTANPTASTLIDRKAPLPDLRVSFTITPASRSLTGLIEDGTITGGVFAPTGSSTPFAAALPATPAAYVGNYTFAASNPVAGDDKPQGYNVGAFKVSATGAASGVLKLADNTTATLSGPVTEGGNIVVYALLYKNTGSVHGLLNIDTGASNQLNASLLGWTRKLQTAATRYFQGGFGPLDLNTLGRRYTIPASGTVAMGLTPGPSNAKLVFTDGLAPSPATRLDVPALEIQAGSPAKVLLPASALVTPTNGSHAKIALSVTPGAGTTFSPGTTGSIKGSFTLVDQDGLTLKNISRTANYTGMIVDDGVEQKAYGWFLLSEMPNNATAPYRSGKVVLSKP